MKKFLFVAVAFFSIPLASAQDIAQASAADNSVYTAVEVSPEFPGGIKEFYKFIGSHYRTPNVKLGGKVLVQFIIEKDGSVSDISVLRDIGYGSGEEAVRVLKESPLWKPGIQNGKEVRCKYELPINIQPVK